MLEKKKEKANLVIPIEKIKRDPIGWSKERKTSLGLLSYNAKSPQYWVEQNSNDNYLVSQELTYYSFARSDSLSNYRYYIYIYMLGITHLFPHNELVHLPYIAVATNTRAD